jgi:cell division transport system permease protein
MTSLERAWRGGRNDWRLHLLSIFSVAVAFVSLASALLVMVNVDGVRERWASTGRASVYLRPEANAEQTESLEKALRGTHGVKEVRRVSSAQARRDVLGAVQDDLLMRLPAEAFPASLEVLLDDQGLIRLEKMTAQLEALPAVDVVETYRSWVERLGALLAGGVTASLLLTLVVLAAVLSVVSSTIRLTLERRRIEVEVLKLVGASDAYVRRPFVVEGAAQGAIGAALALGLLGVLYAIVQSHFDGALGALLGYTPRFLPWPMALAMVLLGAGFGAVAAWASLRKLLIV